MRLKSGDADYMSDFENEVKNYPEAKRFVDFYLQQNVREKKND
jgi:hypothetical protein